MYSEKKFPEPIRCSTRGPKKYSASMLNRMCVRLACANMYVIMVHGRTSTYAGTNASSDVTPGAACCTK